MKTSRLVPLMILFGCYMPPDLPPTYFFGEDTAVCVSAKPVSVTTDLVFEVDVMILSGLSRDYSMDYLEAKDVSFRGSGQYSVQSVEKVHMPNRLPGSVGLLIDQHGSYAKVDTSNFRSKQLNQFINDLSSNPVLVGGFASRGLLMEEPVEFGAPSFTNYSHNMTDYLFGLSKRTGGASVLYDAVLATVAKFPAGANRNLVMIVHGRDSASTATLTSAVSAAVAQSVKVDIIFLGSSSDALPMTPLSQLTGGMFVACPDDGNLVTTINHLNNMYSEEPVMMRITVKFTPPAPLVPGQDTFHEMIIHDSLDDRNLNTVPVYIKVP